MDPRTRDVAITFATRHPERVVRGWFDGYAAFPLGEAVRLLPTFAESVCFTRPGKPSSS